MLHRGINFDDTIKTDEITSIKNITFQVTNNCCLQCTYCYQISKNNLSMNFETAKTFIDNLFNNAEDKNSHINIYNTVGLVLDFVGGEPLMELDLIIQIIDYFEEQFKIRYDYPWVINHKYSFSSNGLLYFDERFQQLLKKYGTDTISYAVTIDGCQECHDKCRIDLNNQGSYERSIRAALDYKQKYGGKGTKITISPDNMQYIFESVKNLILLGYTHINANCIFEHEWTEEEAQFIQSEVIKVKKWIEKHNLQDYTYFSMLDFKGIEEDNEDLTRKHCGASKCMLNIDPKGDLYPCTRFAPNSTCQNKDLFKIGTVETGVVKNEKTLQLEEFENTITYPDECLDCTLKTKCHQCIGCNYEIFGTIFKFNKNICKVYKALEVI